MEGLIDLTGNGKVMKKIITEGTGAQPPLGNNVSVNYAGRLENGKQFDSSKKPFVFKLGAGEVIKGWDVGVASMKLGEKCELTIQPDYGYGSRGAGNVIPPQAVLIFDVELLKF